MAASRQDLFSLLDRLGVAHKTYDHPPVFTVEESAGIKDRLPGGHSKNLFLKDRRGGLWLVSALDETKINLNALAKALEAQRFSFGPGELMVEALGVHPGSVTVFALINDTLNRVSLVLDQALLAHDPVNFHPLGNDATTAIAPDGLLKFLAHTGHPPRLATFDAEGLPTLLDGISLPAP